MSSVAQAQLEGVGQGMTSRGCSGPAEIPTFLRLEFPGVSNNKIELVSEMISGLLVAWGQVWEFGSSELHTWLGDGVSSIAGEGETGATFLFLLYGARSGKFGEVFGEVFGELFREVFGEVFGEAFTGTRGAGALRRPWAELAASRRLYTHIIPGTGSPIPGRQAPWSSAEQGRG